MNLVNLVPLLLAAALFFGIAIYLLWPERPPEHDPSTCQECRRLR